MSHDELTRRQVLQGGAGVAVGGAALVACAHDGISGLAASGPEDPEMPDQVAARYTPITDPLHLTAIATVPSNADAGVNAIALQNPLGLPMEILEIKWALQAVGVTGGNCPGLTGGTIACKLDLGKIPITNGHVPVWSMCPGRFVGREIALIDGAAASDGLPRAACEYAWKLPRPLYVPAGAILVPTFHHRGLIQDDVAVRISYSARNLIAGASPSKRLAIPWAAAFTSKNFTVFSATADADGSHETDLVNPHDETVFLQRFVGRVGSFEFGTTPTVPPSVFSSDTLDPDFAYDLLRLRMRSSLGFPLVRDPLRFNAVFDPTTRSWELPGTEMPPKSYYNVALSSGISAVPAADQQAQVFIGLTGWREIERGAGIGGAA